MNFQHTITAARPRAQALAVGALGGFLFNYLSLPLAWMIGSMLFAGIAGIAGMKVAMPRRLRAVMIIVLGIMLGSGFSPSILDRLGEWMVSFGFLAVYMVAAIAAGVALLQRGGRTDPATAFFTATPGGLNEMVTVGTQMGGDPRTIALSHALRVTLVVMIIPFAFQWLGLYDPAKRGSLGPSLGSLELRDMLLLTACAAGYPLARLLRLPAPDILGPMILSAAIHLAGLTEGRPPGLLVAAAQVVVGASLGARFAGIELRRLGRDGLMAVALTAVMLAITLTTALLVDSVTGLGVAALMLAYAPGGLAEMALVALALHADVALVSSHHMVRVILVVGFAPALFLVWRKWQARRSS